MFTAASDTLRLCGIDAGISTSGRYQAIKPQTLAMDRVTAAGAARAIWIAGARKVTPASHRILRDRDLNPFGHGTVR